MWRRRERASAEEGEGDVAAKDWRRRLGDLGVRTEEGRESIRDLAAERSPEGKVKAELGLGFLMNFLGFFGGIFL